jgi:heme/copper-type cytochrome/quinol oxidase subunit 2
MFLILVFLALICIGVSVWALSDIASKPESAFVGAGMSKLMWVVLIAVFIVVFAPVALVLSVVYLSSVRPKLTKVA